MNYTIEKQNISIITCSYLILKRIFDIIFGILGVVLLIPVSFIVLLLVSYYLYKYFFKKNNIFFDILLFYICLSLSYIISIKLLISIDCDFILNAVGFIGICSIIYLYFKFNKKTPDLIIFQEP